MLRAWGRIPSAQLITEFSRKILPRQENRTPARAPHATAHFNPGPVGDSRPGVVPFFALYPLTPSCGSSARPRQR